MRIQLECCACLRRHVMKKGHDYERRFCCFVGCSVIGCCMIQLVFTYHSILQSLLHYKSRLEKITLLRSHGCDNKVCKVVYFWGIPFRHYQLVVAVRGMTATIVRCELTLTLKQHVGLGLIMFRPNGGVMFVMDYLTVFMFFHPPTGPRIRYHLDYWEGERWPCDQGRTRHEYMWGCNYISGLLSCFCMNMLSA